MQNRTVPSSIWGRFFRLILPDQYSVYSALTFFLLIFLGATVFGFVYICGTLFQPDLYGQVSALVDNNFAYVPGWLRGIIVQVMYCFDPQLLRYYLPPILTISTLFYAAARYIKDVYNLASTGTAFAHLLRCLFGIGIPTIKIKGGKVVSPTSKNHPALIIGGPAFAMIERGNAVLFRRLNRATRASLNGSYFMGPFESIAHIANLDDQEGQIDSIGTITQDGILVRVRDIRYRFRICSQVIDGRTIQRSLEMPYPHAEEAFLTQYYNLSVSAMGLTPWHKAISLAVDSAISDVVNAYPIDFLTSPTGDGRDPRKLLQENLFSNRCKASLERAGAELLWIDVGHIDIVDEAIDQQRLDNWAADLIGNQDIIRAYSASLRQATVDMAKTQAQAEIIVGITSAVSGMDLTGENTDRLRALILARTAQVIESVSDAKQSGG